MKRKVGLSLAVIALVLMLPRLLAQQGDRARFAGRIVDEQGQPLAGVPVAALRARSLAKLPADQLAVAEATLKTDADGRFALDVPAAMPGLDQVIFYTAAPGRQNVILPATPFAGTAPTVAMLRAETVTAYDLTAPTDPVEVVLKPGGATPAAAPAATTTNGLRLETFQVAMRDGTKLATDVAFPDGDGPWPVVLSRTPYGRAGKLAGSGYPAMGIVAVLQDVRGRFDSEGGNFAFKYDGWGPEQDGVDTIAWLLRQSWCNGKVGTEGGSAGGITQVLTAAAAPDGLVAQAIGVAFSSMYHHATYVGGAYQLSLIEGWLSSNSFDPQNLVEVKAHETYDAYWQAFDAGARAAKVTVPALFVGGWYDVFQQGTIDAFKQRQEHGGPGAKGQQKLVIGPWPHGRKRQVGELTYPENGMQPPAPSNSRWLRHYLLGEDNGVEDVPAVSYYQMGAVGEPGAPGNQWRTAESWPPPSTPQSWYLHPDGSLNVMQPPTDGAAKTFDYDPANPVPTKGGNNLTIPSGPFDQRELENRPDVLLFTSAPLAAPLAITGPVSARIWFASSARDTDLTVKLTDVYPDGRSMLVLDGIRRLKFRNGFERPEPLVPGQAYDITVELWSTSLVVNQGHRLRVAVSSSNAPRFGPHANVFGPLAEWATKVIAHQTLYLDAAHPSRLILPVTN